MELVILAAGMGSRFGGLKQIEPMDAYGNFIIDYSIYDAIEAGFDSVTFIIKKEMLEDFKNTVGKRIEKRINVKYAFQELKLPKVYLNVLSENVRAQRFYEKWGFIQEGIAKDAVRIKESYKSLIWYGIFEENDKE